MIKFEDLFEIQGEFQGPEEDDGQRLPHPYLLEVVDGLIIFNLSGVYKYDIPIDELQDLKGVCWWSRQLSEKSWWSKQMERDLFTVIEDVQLRDALMEASIRTPDRIFPSRHEPFAWLNKLIPEEATFLKLKYGSDGEG